MSKLHLDWYRWIMGRGPKPDFLEANVAYYVMGAERWRYADTLDAITSQSVCLFLTSRGNTTDLFHAGSLDSKPSDQSDPDSYVYDPRDISGAEVESTIDPDCLTDQRMIHALTGKQLIYHSASFDRDVEIAGFFKLSAWLSIDQPDTDFRVCVYEIGIDGSSILLSADTMRARYRQGLRDPALIRTQEPLRYDFERFMFVAREIKRGHRLRLVIGPINSIYSQRNYNSGGVVAEESIRASRLITVKLFHDLERPSVLYVPFGRPE